MTYFDEEYIKLVKRILKEGEEVENRTGINTIKLPEHLFSFDLRKGFPILQTKQTAYKNAILEMLWIWQVKSNDVKWLQDRNVPIWNEWMVDEDGIYRIYEPVTAFVDYNPNKEVIVLDPLSASLKDPLAKMTPLSPKLDENGKVMTAKSLIPGKNIKMAKYYGKEYANTIGTAYGYIVNRYGYTDELIWTIKNNHTDRRMVYSLWQNEFLRTAVLPSCVWSTEWNVYKDTLNLQIHQRSCDVGLGLPFNVTQYATFLKMIAQVTNLEPGIISYSINEPHIYVNHLDGLNEQIRRAEVYDELKDYSELELLCEKRGNLIEMKHLDKESAKYKRLEVNNNIIDLLLEPSKPDLILNKDINDFDYFDNSRELKDVKVTNYKHMGKIKLPIAQ